MDRNNISFFLPLFLLIAFWDAFTTVYGTIYILGGVSLGSIITGLIIAILMLVLFMLTFEIWSNDSSSSDFGTNILRWMWLLSLFYDVFTSFYGNNKLIVAGEGTIAATVVVILSTLIVCGSTIIASYILHTVDNKN